MIKNITSSEFVKAFHDHGRAEAWSNEGLDALYDYVNMVDPDMELDVVGLDCEYCESEVLDIINDYSLDDSDCEDDYDRAELAKEYLRENTSVIAELSNDCIVYCYSF